MINTADVQIPTLPHQVRGLRTLGQDPTSLIAEASYLPPILGPHIVCASACEVLLKHKQDDATALLRSLSCFSLTQSKHESPRKGPRGPLCPDTGLSCPAGSAPLRALCRACSASGGLHALFSVWRVPSPDDGTTRFLEPFNYLLKSCFLGGSSHISYLWVQQSFPTQHA